MLITWITTEKHGSFETPEELRNKVERERP
jgi:hypothetical protein